MSIAADLFLASASPRRRALLEQIGVRFEVLVIEVDETPRPDEPADEYVLRLAREKALTGAARARARCAPQRPVLAADTSVVLDGAILGKPVDQREAAAMLQRLSDRTHEVLTAIAIAQGEGVEVACSRSAVRLRAIDPAEALAYWRTGEPCDKAGGYAIQGLGAVFVRELQGSFSGVMGLPLYETAQLLARAGVPLWQSPAGDTH